jgi:NAD(P)-dependent dehydrogenase (short-subunit alcohol dehydrogenase family)
MNEERDLDGLSALVTGATSGIGQAVAEALARHGAQVIVHGGMPSAAQRPRTALPGMAARPASLPLTSAIRLS